ncbi:MAG: ATP-binding protein [Thermoguttaceae bacterium]
MALEAAPIGVVMVDDRGTMVLVNAEAERLFGYRREELLGQALEMLVPLRFREHHAGYRSGFSASAHARAMGAGRDLFAVRKDGSEFPVEIGLNPVRTEDGLFVLSVIADITRRKAAEQELLQLNATLEERVAQRAREAEVRAVMAQRTAEALQREVDQRRRAEEELRTAKEAAEAASHAKSTFLANMSHEIRTPLNAVIGLTALVLDTELSAEQQEYLNLVRDSGEALLQVINDILDFSKIEAGRMDLARTPFDHSEVVGDAMKSLAFRSHSKGLELLLRLPPNHSSTLVGDPHRLRQVIVNLVGNAIKFTDSGQVMLEATVRSPTEGQVEVHYTVSDTGIGIPTDKQDDIFQAFEQLDGSSARRHGGTGLGLAICRRLVEMMGGRIWVESQRDRGTAFHFTVRFEVSGETIPESVPPESLEGLRVLIVDDNGVNRRILSEMVRAWRMEPMEAAGHCGWRSSIRTCRA